jgi:hypothetical protein
MNLFEQLVNHSSQFCCYCLAKFNELFSSYYIMATVSPCLSDNCKIATSPNRRCAEKKVVTPNICTQCNGKRHIALITSCCMLLL